MSFVVPSFIVLILIFSSCQKGKVTTFDKKLIGKLKIKKVKKVNLSKNTYIERIDLDHGERILVTVYLGANEDKAKLLGDLFISSFKSQAQAYPDFITRFRRCPKLENLSFKKMKSRYVIDYVANQNYITNFCEKDKAYYQVRKEIRFCKKDKKVVSLTYFYIGPVNSINFEERLLCE